MNALISGISNKRLIAKFQSREAPYEDKSAAHILLTKSVSLALTGSNWVIRSRQFPYGELIHVQMPRQGGPEVPIVYETANDTMLCAHSPVWDGTDAAIVYQEPMKDAVAINAFQALGQPTRLAALKLLVSAGKDGLAAGVLSRALKVQPSSVTPHLNVLAQAGLVSSRRDGRHIIYSADLVAIGRLHSFLGEFA